MLNKIFLIVSILCLQGAEAFVQNKMKSPVDGIFIDKAGIMRWKSNKKEASFFGVNYTVPFAYGYRSHKALGIELEKAIDQDVYHLARLGVDAFRVHVWDTEITDSLGNLLENDHLRLYDYLLNKLEQRNIKIILTPIAFWGNGYPERDEHTPGFSSIYNKQKALVTEAAIKAQENYLQQILKHINSYTHLPYGEDANIIALEINNEPHHSGPKQKTTEYVNRLAMTVRTSGWLKPIFYNISESPGYADAIARSQVDGFSFQWYPTGLVANRTLKGNYLPNVDQYTIPFDSIPQFANKARMVYEFDAGDILQSCMYPAMARSFRTAGFQWATQFAYDPMATAYANTEYQTHYLNLAYTPSKAISLLIASRVFHRLPRLKKYGIYPADSSFDVFRVSYLESLSEMNAEEEFYYSNSTETKAVNIEQLQHIAGVGSSSLVQYPGYGAYFIDKLENGIWRLELMPDAIPVRDPFEKASPKKEVTHIQWQVQPMKILLPDLGMDFVIKGLNPGNNFSAQASAGNFSIQPGVFLLVRRGKENNSWTGVSRTGVIQLNEFVAPGSFSKEPALVHQPYYEVTPGKPISISAFITELDSGDKVTVILNKLWGQYRNILMQRKNAYEWTTEFPADLLTPGLLNYKIVIQKSNNEFMSFPGTYLGNPFAWDYYHNDVWQTYIAAPNSSMELFNAATDRDLFLFPALRRNNEVQFITTEKPGKLALSLSAKDLAKGQVVGWQYFFAHKLKGRSSELSSFDRLVLRVRTNESMPLPVKVALISIDAIAYSTYITVTNKWNELSIPLLSLQKDSSLLLPRPYPGFLPLWFKGGAQLPFQLNKAEKLEISIGLSASPGDTIHLASFEVESIWLEKGHK